MNSFTDKITRRPFTLLGLVGLLSLAACARAKGAPSAGAGGANEESGKSEHGAAQPATDVLASAPTDNQAEEESPLQATADCVQSKAKEQCSGDYCRIEPGCFIMGSPQGEFGRALVAEDQVQVTLTHAFWLGKTEVTRAQWKRSGLPTPKLVQLNGRRECLEADCPQGNVSFYDALRYANRLSEREKLKPCYVFEGAGCTGSILTKNFECPSVRVDAPTPYECEGYRLPTEAEWEYAARAGTKTAFPSGDVAIQPSPSECAFDASLDAIGWYCANSLEQTQRVAQKQPNDFGLHDMHGNALELVSDLYGPSGYLAPGAPRRPLVDPTGAVNGASDLTKTTERPFRVTRGGAHNLPAPIAKSSRRLGGVVDSDSASNIGFRIARTIR